MLVIEVGIQNWMSMAGIQNKCSLCNAVIYDLDSR